MQIVTVSGAWMITGVHGYHRSGSDAFLGIFLAKEGVDLTKLGLMVAISPRGR